MDGKLVSVEVLKGIPLSGFTSATAWPRQGAPTKTMWALWKNRILRVFTRDGKARNLRLPLGAWLDGNWRAEEWGVLASTNKSQQAIFRRRTDGRTDVVRQVIDRGSRSQVSGVAPTIVDMPPGNVVPAEIGKHVGGMHKVTKRGS